MRFLLPALTLLASASALAAREATPIAVVLSVEGQASLEPEHTNLKKGMKLAEGERITVMSASFLRLRLVTGEVAELGPHSELQLKRALTGLPLLRIPHGELLLVSKGDREIEVRASQVHLRVSAKAFYLGQKLDKPSYVCVCDGEAWAKWPLGKATLASRKDHKHRPVLIDILKPTATQALADESHDDRKIEALRELL